MKLSRLPVIASVALAACTAGAQAASSGWYHVEGGSIRIVTSGGPDEAGRVRGALEIRLKPGWKTYWRDPGASGVPPTLTASAGGADAAVEIGFPPPGRFDDGYAPSAGYDHPVSLALELELPEGMARPARLQADVFLGVCETICIPVQATLSFEPGAGAEKPEDAAVVAAAFAALPAPERPGFAAEATGISDGVIMVATKLPEGVRALDLFVAGTPQLALGTPERAGDGTTFRVPVTARHGDGTGTLTYTLVTDAGAVAGVIALPQR